MNYNSLRDCLDDLEKNGHLIRIKEELDPNLEMAAIHLKVFKNNGPAILFEKVKGSRFQAVSNLFGTLERSQFIFRDNIEQVQTMVQLRNNPLLALKSPFRYFSTALAALKALPKKKSLASSEFEEISIDQLPLIKHWPMDGGAFVTLPQVYSEDADAPGVMKSNLGMYRIQLSGNDYIINKEIGLHYQLHRGIGIHQSKTNKLNKPLKVSVFVGGPPSHTLAAVMPLPEGISELTFAGALGGKRFRYAYDENGNCLSLDADFVITGEVYPLQNKPEGPFGDHLGYYSLTHPFPLMKVNKVYAKKNGIWAFTVVGRPPQEDTAFGALIHEISGSAIPKEIPGVKEVHAVDAAGVHPLLLAVGSERYTPYLKTKRPSELLTQANRILGTGQLSLAKYLFIAADDETDLNCHDLPKFFQFVLERLDLTRDLHFQTKTSMDTLDYSGDGINTGSKLVIAAYGDKKRNLCTSVPSFFNQIHLIKNCRLLLPGVIAFETKEFESYEAAKIEMKQLNDLLLPFIKELEGVVQLIIYNDFEFTKHINDYLWITYTRSNPSHDIYGIEETIEHKHWGCIGPMVIDARKKPHHAPELKILPETEQVIERFFKKGGPLEKWAGH
ncbi:MAG: UbiD family decarboxylase [Bacteroidota bacterium]